ncbi:IclR family transcriptional regulator [Allorhizocola rhizosphaerae]|uniref:IclR family transcriptional regulator n=1 Tax=Allorhizocola rhizosphaerae TaxID=1872709 RepID=UPI0013C2CB88|nr:helix-turn-helix domain-containing protein [Allorhizocola rhizosphaerae]
MDDHTVVGRMLAVLDAVADLADAATLAALTRCTGIPKPTVRRIAADLCARGVLLRAGGSYRLGPRLLELGLRTAAKDSLRLAAAPHIWDLFARTGEIVWISTITETSHFLLDSAFGANRASDMRRPWPTTIRSMGFLTTAAGRILLADRPELAEELGSQPIPRLTPYSLTTWPRLIAAARAAAEDGIATEREQSLLGYSCMAAGIRGPDHTVVGVLGVLGRAHAMALHRFTRPLLAAADDIEQALHRAAGRPVGRPASRAVGRLTEGAEGTGGLDIRCPM